MSVTTPVRVLPRASTVCRQCLLSLRYQIRASNRERTAATTSRALRRNMIVQNVSAQKSDDNAQSLPRWAATPSAMRAPYKIRPANDNDDYPCNEDPQVLDKVYDRFLGKDGKEGLDDSVKWLAVTHKSFDHGRRGYNERLAFMGRKMMELQTSLALLDRGVGGEKQREHLKRKDAYGRYPELDPALAGVGNISIYQKEQVLDEKRLAQLGERVGLVEAVRWKPRQIRDLQTSGVDNVLATAIYAIIGAIALQKGGQVANDTIRKRVLGPLGVI